MAPVSDVTSPSADGGHRDVDSADAIVPDPTAVRRLNERRTARVLSRGGQTPLVSRKIPPSAALLAADVCGGGTCTGAEGRPARELADRTRWTSHKGRVRRHQAA